MGMSRFPLPQEQNLVYSNLTMRQVISPKVVQRISVRIACWIDPNQKGIEKLRPGMSVISSVDTDSNVD